MIYSFFKRFIFTLTFDLGSKVEHYELYHCLLTTHSPFPITFLFSRLFRLIQISAEQPDLWTRGDLVARTFIACVKRLTRL
ncbi:hypothetical protein RCL_jg7164.t1 [Rhizophagus clarus]|uniref:Uncharacterized protein n=1 Tax=Rhizophagus clarus TaxID=94130 RepID=A0A8H3M653_9GLOM|nr:hypothetical protein RCL_jg7164.t1 [Rhizophagus clarus]